ncbi:MAG: hypothetical protein ACJ754_13090 [Pyrinomonadaceae bacterium]
MSAQILVPNTGELLGWEEAFMLLSINRCRPLLPYAGVPAAVLEDAMPLARASHFFWESVWNHSPLKVGPHWDKATFSETLLAQFGENFRSALKTLLRGTYDIITAGYGPEVGCLLCEWAQRHFVSDTQRGNLSAWTRLWLRLANASALYYPLAPLHLAPHILRDVKKAVRQRLHLLYIDAGEGGMGDLFNTAAAVPLTPIERRMVQMERAYPDDPDEVDILLTLKFVIQRQASYQIWKVISGWLSDGDREALMRWAREQAAILKEPAEIIPPDAEASQIIAVCDVCMYVHPERRHNKPTQGRG